MNRRFTATYSEK